MEEEGEEEEEEVCRSYPNPWRSWGRGTTEKISSSSSSSSSSSWTSWTSSEGDWWIHGFCKLQVSRFHWRSCEAKLVFWVYDRCQQASTISPNLKRETSSFLYLLFLLFLFSLWSTYIFSVNSVPENGSSGEGKVKSAWPICSTVAASFVWLVI